ncbi:MAG: superoxide dismutase family protein [Brevundimonas sp.]|uniref:superoxide dismutase family protein n=1 Tax=Brevundimonas sp. TaxID=1871086 RepID=UPI002720AD8C|nr:superoxide dismutase family protein [Brevundimonas sp.]MDO9587041.1 superoxide dismutase family protein [Brevundimonas sp.]MDP3368293.1 superoxide dismutase family protein [Brevundimonas sp.]MDP3656170.1 superoxide dismutase family protein [Brevundimonas sp.]MDZ4108178.1 superoxide dismutase family protein [Brevundimonas sp.]
MRAARLTAFALLPLAAALAGCVSVSAHDRSEAPRRAAMGDFGEATLVNASGDRVGRAVLTQGPTGLLIRIEAEGLTPGWHGVHIHATGRCDAPFTSAGAHVNHGEAPHGLLNPGGPDDGDLPNIHADAAGRVRAEVFTTRARIAADGPGQWLSDADGSALVIHANADDHASQPIGGAGARVACGVMAAG